MTIDILNPNGTFRNIEVSKEFEQHYNLEANHAHTILNQINGGMYQKWFGDKKDLVVLDIGSNVGLTALYFLPACHKLLCVEPTPSHRKLMADLLNRSGIGEKAYIHPNALTMEDKEYDFFTCESSTENRITKNGQSEGAGTRIKVQGKPLAYFLSQIESPVDFCKIDIEGGEMEALTIEQLENAYDKVKMFYVEVHPTAGHTQEANMVELMSRFATTAYTIERINFETFTATSAHKFL